MGGAPLAALLLVLAPAGARGQTPAGLVRVDSVVVRGVDRLTAADVTGASGIRTGALHNWLDVNRALKNIWATGQHEDLAARMETVDGRNTLVLEVVERPLARIVRIAGLESVSDDDVFGESGLEQNAPLSLNGLAKARAYIREELRRRGVPYARIDQRVQAVPGDDGSVDVVLEVEEGQRVTVAEVVFGGNEHFSDEDLRGVMNTKPEGFLWFRSGDYDDIDFEADLEVSLPLHYSRAGFLDFRVLGDTLIVDPSSGKARIEVQVDEGPQYRLGELVVEGNSAFDDERLRAYFTEDAGGLLAILGFDDERSRGVGRVFDKVAFEESAGKIQQRYSDEGYLFARVEPYYEKEEDGTVRAVWRILEGEQAYINRIVVSGNDFTYDRVIREKIFLLPGDVYSQARVLQSYQNIQSLGFFETPLPLPDILTTESGDVDIVFNVKEKQTGSVSFGTAVGGGVGLSGFLGYDQPNLLGQAKAGSIRWDFGRYINSFTLSFTDPALFQTTVSGSVSLFNSTDRFYQFATGRRQRAGFQTRFGIPFPGSRQTRVFFGYSLARTEYEAFRSASDRSLFGLPTGLLSSFSVGITRQTLNHPLFPTSGSRQSWNVELNGGPLGGAGDFVKHTANAQWMIPVGQLGGGGGGGVAGVRFALGLSVRGGALFGDASGFPFESFWLGGVQFGEPLRGYDETTVTPRGYFPEGPASGINQVDRLGNAFLSATAEYKAVVNSNLGVSMFYDAGNLWHDPGEINTSKFFRGAGFGVQLVTPFGPIGLDYAYGFDKPEPGWQLHFKMGPNF